MTTGPRNITSRCDVCNSDICSKTQNRNESVRRICYKCVVCNKSRRVSATTIVYPRLRHNLSYHEQRGSNIPLQGTIARRFYMGRQYKDMDQRLRVFESQTEQRAHVDVTRRSNMPRHTLQSGIIPSTATERHMVGQQRGTHVLTTRKWNTDC